MLVHIMEYVGVPPADLRDVCEAAILEHRLILADPGYHIMYDGYEP